MTSNFLVLFPLYLIYWTVCGVAILFIIKKAWGFLRDE